ncbi:MAG: nucleoside triphosphate pyrophosphohydrolase family protein [bacterium]|nr:nucleoside triphosphate pyrophosphohydrolase family protein [bacterium]
MDFDEYQQAAKKTAIYPNQGKNLIYPTLGFVGEAGELADKVKKIFRDDKGRLSEEVKQGMLNEIGDVLWYMAALCTELKTSINSVAEKNLARLGSRQERGVIPGSGDDR